MENITVRQYLESMILSREIVDRFLDPGAYNWAAFDSELGYRLRDCVIQNGVDSSCTFNHYQPSGERRMVNYAEQPCRIDTYGDSIVKCHQVSDGETWQEYLAAHLGEPVRNLGVGGYGVYQSYRRMLKIEDSALSAEYILLNVHTDDHYRGIYKWRMLHIPEFIKIYVAKTRRQTCMFHTNPWAHVRLNQHTGQFEEQENPYSTPESLYLLCDKDHVYDAFKDDFDIQAMLAQKGARDIRYDLLENIAQILDVPVNFNSPESTAHSAKHLLHVYAVRATMFILENLVTFIKPRNKKLMLMLNYSQSETIGLLKGTIKPDMLFLDYLQEKSYRFVDTRLNHEQDFRSFNLSVEEYAQRYYVGHYNPRGNHFIAFSIKDAVVEWLDPKPPAYRGEAYFNQ